MRCGFPGLLWSQLTEWRPCRPRKGQTRGPRGTPWVPGWTAWDRMGHGRRHSSRWESRRELEATAQGFRFLKFRRGENLLPFVGPPDMTSRSRGRGLVFQNRTLGMFQNGTRRATLTLWECSKIERCRKVRPLAKCSKTERGEGPKRKTFDAMAYTKTENKNACADM